MEDVLEGKNNQWEFQHPKMEVLYHIRPHFVGIFPYIGLKHRPYMVGTSNKSVPEMAIETTFNKPRDSFLESVLPHNNSKGRKRSHERRFPSHTAWIWGF